MLRVTPHLLTLLSRESWPDCASVHSRLRDEASGEHEVQNYQFSHWCFHPLEGCTLLATSSPQRQRPANPELCAVDWGSLADSLAVTDAPSLPIKTHFSVVLKKFE